MPDLISKRASKAMHVDLVKIAEATIAVESALRNIMENCYRMSRQKFIVRDQYIQPGFDALELMKAAKRPFAVKRKDLQDISKKGAAGTDGNPAGTGTT